MQDRGEDLVHVLEQLVLACLEQEAVEAEVRLHEGIEIVAGGSHRLVRFVESCDLLVGGTLRREACGGGLDDPAQLQRLLEKLRIRAGFDLPGEQVGVEEVPIPSRPDAGADLRPRLDQSFRSENLDRFPHHGSAHLRLVEESVVGQRVPRFEPTVDDPDSDLVHDGSVQAAPRIRAPFSHTIIL